MSKERNLLKKFIDSNWQYDDWCLLKAEAEELLAQPEQEIIGWWWEQYDVENNEWFSMADTYVDDKPIENEYIRNITPLYTAPPKREPLDDRKISHGFRISKKAIHAESFWIGVKFAEKAHGIGE